MAEAETAPVAEWQQLLNTLFPSGQHVLRDVLGHEYTVRTVLPARKEAELMRVLSKVAQLPVSEWTQGFNPDVLAGTSGTRDALSALLGLVGKLSQEPQVLALLDEAFTLVFRAQVDQALASARGEDPQMLDGIVSPSAVDVFDTVEMVKALLPFGGKLVKQITTAMGQMRQSRLPTT